MANTTDFSNATHPLPLRSFLRTWEWKLQTRLAQIQDQEHQLSNDVGVFSSGLLAVDKTKWFPWEPGHENQFLIFQTKRLSFDLKNHHLHSNSFCTFIE
jgi:hypothetical protein